MTKAEYIMTMVNRVYSMIGMKAIADIVTGKIVVDFIGEFEGKPAKMTFNCSNRRQVSLLLKHFRRDVKGVMTWVKFVVISHANRGPVKNSKGEWKSRPRVLDFHIKTTSEQPTPEAPQPETPAPISAAEVQDNSSKHEDISIIETSKDKLFKVNWSKGNITVKVNTYFAKAPLPDIKRMFKFAKEHCTSEQREQLINDLQTAKTFWQVLYIQSSRYSKNFNPYSCDSYAPAIPHTSTQHEKLQSKLSKVIAILQQSEQCRQI